MRPTIFGIQTTLPGLNWGHQVKILLIEDEPLDAAFITRSVEAGFPQCFVDRVTTVAEAVQRVQSHRYDIALIDLSLPDSEGMASVSNILRFCKECPVIVLTGTENQTIALQAIEKGVQDFLVKGDIQPAQLDRAIRFAIQRHSLRRRNDELLASLRESEELLESKNKKLEQVCRSRDRFVESIATEIRSPIERINKYLNVISRSISAVINPEQSRLFGWVDDQSNYLKNLVDDMVAVGKLESGVLEANRQACSIDNLFVAPLKQLQQKCELRGTRLHVNLESDLPEVYCDGAKVVRVLAHLVHNAIELSRRPSEVSVSVRRSGDEDVLVSVSDNGFGMQEPDQQSISKRFTESRVQRRSRPEQLDLKLDIIQELAELNFGNVWLETVQDQGNTFSFTIPINRPAEITRRCVRTSTSASSAVAGYSLVKVSLFDEVDETTSKQVNRFLTQMVRQSDLVFRCSPDQWLLVLAVPQTELEAFYQRLRASHGQVIQDETGAPLPELHLEAQNSWNRRKVDINEIVECVRKVTAEGSPQKCLA